MTTRDKDSSSDPAVVAPLRTQKELTHETVDTISPRDSRQSARDVDGPMGVADRVELLPSLDGADTGRVASLRTRPPQEQLRKAERIARDAHVGQFDTATDAPYIRHVERVVGRVDSEDAKAVAWLHDVLEDSGHTANTLLDAGVPPHVVDAVVLLTRTPPYEYAAYIEALAASGNALAIEVKLADLIDHLHPNCPPRLIPRYRKALARLGALRTALPSPQPQGWQDITTAPKDGSYVVLLGRSEIPDVGRWFNYNDVEADGWWTVHAIRWAPTHWMPLPALPDPPSAVLPQPQGGEHCSCGSTRRDDPRPECQVHGRAHVEDWMTDGRPRKASAVLPDSQEPKP